MQTARDIYQDHLDEVSRALWDRDFFAITELKHFPHVIRYPDTEARFDTPADLCATMEAFRSKLDGLGATGYHRVCERASFDPLDRNRITGAHWTYIMRGGNYLSEPYSCEMVLVHKEPLWIVADIIVPELKHGIPTPPRRPTRSRGPLQ